MDEFLDVVTEVLSAVVYAVGAIVTGALGLAAEYAGYQQFAAGEALTHTLWLGVIGAIALYTAFNLFAEFRAELA
jgi:hypothetical protein